MKVIDSSREFAVEALFPGFHNEQWVSYTLKSVLEAMAGDGVRIGISTLAKGRSVTAPYVHPIVDRRLFRYVNPWIKDPMRWTFREARKRLRRGDVAYFWLGCPPDLCAYFRANGVMVVREMINCTQQLRRRELRKAYAALGMPDLSGISDATIEKEREDILALDAVFCPNPYVRSSIIEYGFPAERCIDASYGWSPERLGTAPGAPATSLPGGADHEFTAAFVGTVDVRKGAPVLLQAWALAGVKGRLLLAGTISAEVRKNCAHILARKDVIELGHVSDVGAVYRAADVFCFPTWEEGGPLVTLEAMAVGAVPIVTPMGTSGAFGENEEAGIVVPPGSIEALSQALRTLAADKQQLARMKRAALARAAHYRWDLVGARRREGLKHQREAWIGRSRSDG